MLPKCASLTRIPNNKHKLQMAKSLHWAHDKERGIADVVLAHIQEAFV